MFSTLKSLLNERAVPRIKNEVCLEHKQPKSINFSYSEPRVILRGKCLSHLNNFIIYTGMDIATGEQFVVKEQIFYDLREEQKQKIEEHLTLLIRIGWLTQLEDHNLAKIKNFTWEHRQLENKWSVYILEEFTFGFNCVSLFLTNNIPVQTDILRLIAKGILNVLDLLDKNGVTCINVMKSSVYMDNNGKIKFTNYEIDETMSNSVSTQLEHKSDNIYNFGILLLSLIKGKVIENDDLQIPKSVSSTLHDFLIGCINECKQERLTVDELLNHPFIQTSCDWLDLVKVPDTQDVLHKPAILERSKSRVEHEFEILESLGRGGFGEVVKAQNKLDKRLYALKKIKLNPDDEKSNNKLIREVHYLSMLNHENIVRYFTAWTDTENVSDSEEETDSSDSEDSLKIDQYERDQIDLMAEQQYLMYLDSNDCYDDYDIMAHSGKSEVNSNNSAALFTTTEDDMPIMKQSVRKILYIQMEFCKRKTLRTVIDNGNLYQDVDRIWKFLREIVEGLVHIHQQGIIHRDLKPMNIFLDSNDHVKIGDFGLATTNIRYKRENKQEHELAVSLTKMESGSSTSQVGTGLYKAPELCSSALVCNQKLDMYSLGIILFEMCYARPETESERIEVLTNVRRKEILFPPNFNCHEEHQKIIRELLSHNPVERPTSKELLKSKRIPPIVEEEKLQEMFKHVIDNPQMKLYKYVMECCFNEKADTQYGYNFDFDCGYRNISQLDFIKEALSNIFKIHGGQNLSMSAVMPQNSCYDDCSDCVKLMTRTGRIVSRPCNMRTPFARYVALNKSIGWLRRFSIERIPKRYTREIYECIFDIITPINLRKYKNFLPDAEILEIMNEIKDTFLSLKPDGFCINLNHSLLIQAIFLECGIQYNHQNYTYVFRVLKCIEGVSIRSRVFEKYFKLEMASKLARLMDISCPINKSNSILQYFTDNKAKHLAKSALEELKCIVESAETFGVRCDIKIVPDLLQNYEQYSGMLVEFVYHSARGSHVLAAGGRYDSVIKKFQDSSHDLENARLNKYGVGISVYLETLCPLLDLEKHKNTLDIVILRELWSAGISCSFINIRTKRHLRSWCRKYNISYAIILIVKKFAKGIVALAEWTNRWTSCQETQMNIHEVIATLKQSANDDQVRCLRLTQIPKVDTVAPIIFKTTEELSVLTKFNYRNIINKQTSDCQQRLHGNTVIMVLSIKINMIMKLTSLIKFDRINYEQSLQSFTNKYPALHSYLKLVCDQIYETKLHYEQLNLILYSIGESSFFLHFL